MTQSVSQSVSTADVPERSGVIRDGRDQELQVLQDKILQEGAPVELVTLDVVHSVAALAGDDIVEEDVLGDAEEGAVREEVVPDLSQDATMQLAQPDPGQELPEEARHEDVVQPGSLHQSRVVFD